MRLIRKVAVDVSAVVASVILACMAGTADASQGVRPRKDTPYAGRIELRLDATDLERRILRARETVPVRSGALTLYYPKWIPANHAPRGPIEAFAGLTITGNGQRIAWQRDALDVYAFHLTVPPGVKTLQLEFQYISPSDKDMGRITMTPEILGVQWETALLYPAGYDARRISFQASVKLPSGWQYATALTTDRREGDVVHFAATTLETLADSPLFAGKYFTRVDLDPGAQAPVYLDVFADTPEELEISPTQLALHRNLVREATAVFGSRHFDRYDFLLAISDHFGGNVGLEHHRSSENAVARGYFTDEKKMLPRWRILPHEFVHSWNGKFRRPAGELTPDFNVPMQDGLLWVYEGQTTFWDLVLAARCGLWSAETARAALAVRAAILQDRRVGRAWRDLQDTNYQSVITPRKPLGWISWQRGEDYYNEGAMIWLDVDTKLRELSGEKRSLDDFAAAFFGMHDGSHVPLPYTVEDVVRTLKHLTPFDWAAFLQERLTSNAGAPLEGLERAGWRLTYKEEPSEYSRSLSALAEEEDFSFSIGVVLGPDAKLTEVVWDSPAFRAGLSRAHTLIAVNGRAYRPEVLARAIRDAKNKSAPIVLLLRSLDHYTSVTLQYSGGLRYPHLERIERSVDRLADIFRSRTR